MNAPYQLPVKTQAQLNTEKIRALLADVPKLSQEELNRSLCAEQDANRAKNWSNE